MNKILFKRIRVKHTELGSKIQKILRGIVLMKNEENSETVNKILFQRIRVNHTESRSKNTKDLRGILLMKHEANTS